MLCKHDCIVIGGGAAGLMAAITASERGKKVLLIEHTAKIGEKIRISGGGRCNFTNLYTSSNNFICQNPHFVKSALAGYSQHDFIDLIKSHNIAYHEKTLGQLFCDGSSKQIIDMLVGLCQANGVDIKLSCSVEEVTYLSSSGVPLSSSGVPLSSPRKRGSTAMYEGKMDPSRSGDDTAAPGDDITGNDTKFKINTNQGIFTSKSLIIASGGLSIPKIGASDFGYRIAKQFGLNIIPTRPALVPLIVPEEVRDLFTELRGISNFSIVSYKKTSFTENILFTHKGLSGPAILQISSYLDDLNDAEIFINLLPNLDLEQVFILEKNSKQTVANYLKIHLTNRLVDNLALINKDLNESITDLSKEKLQKAAKVLHSFQVAINDSEGYQKAEVTGGGVDTNELSSKTMECKKTPGLFFIGEVVDVTGWLGGYNFQWAWSSGVAAGRAV